MKRAFIASVALASGAVWADGPTSFDPPTQAVCMASEVDKALLAAWALDHYSISRSYEVIAAKHPGDTAFPNATPGVEIIVDANFCKWKKNPNGKFPCSDDDAQAILQAHMGLLSWIESPAKEYDNSAIPAPMRGAYFADSTLVMTCKSESKKAKPPSSPAFLAHLRARGNADVLRVDQKSADFKAVANASLSISRDDFSDKTTAKVVGVVGYQIFSTSNTYGDFEVIPYFGINRNTTNALGKTDSVTANTRDVGVVIDASYVSTSLNNVFTLRPDYLSDLQHHSHIESLNGTYMPVVSSWLNVYNRIVRGRDDFASIMPILDFRIDTGHYKNCGLLKPDQCRSYTRIGSQFGFSMASDNESHPISLAVTDTRLFGTGRHSHDIDYLKLVMSYALNKDKTAALDLGYSEGRREDTALEEKLWSVSLGVKY